MDLSSDLHIGSVNSEMDSARTVNDVNNIAPGAVRIAGDIFDNDVDTVGTRIKTSAGLTKLRLGDTFGRDCILG